MTKLKTANDLPDPAKDKMIGLLQARLVDAIDLKTQVKQAHWNVKGPSFGTLHALFDTVAEAVEEHVDELAERLVQLGGTALGTARVVAGTSTLPEYPADIYAGLDHVKAVTRAMATHGKCVREAIDVAAQAGDADTADLFTEVSREVDKYLWMVEAHGQAER